MRLKIIIGALIVVQLALFVHLLFLLSTPGLSGQYAVAQAGGVARVDVSPTTVWGGLYGSLAPDGSPVISVTEMGVNEQDVYYDDPDNNCSKTELFAATSAVNAQDVEYIDPAAADILLGFSPADTFSVSAMFTQQHAFDIAGNALTLWTTQTNGKLTPFIQGVGQANGNVVFITTTGRNTQAYNGQHAGYQFILPAGVWDVTYDAMDVCSVLDEYAQPEETQKTTRLDIAFPARMCVDEQNTVYAVEITDRTFCTPNEVGQWWCKPQTGVKSTVKQGGSDVYTSTTEDSGAITFTPTIIGQHEITVQETNRTTRRFFKTEECRSDSLVVSESRTISLLPPNIQIGDVKTPREEEAAAIIATANAEFVLISMLTVIVTVLASIAYYETHKDTIAFLLKLRIWVLERLR